MPSSKTRSLAGRVALASALAAALGGAVAALAAGVTATSLIDEHDERLALQSTRALARETLEELEDEIDDRGNLRARPSLAAALAHGLADLDLPGARASLHRGGRLEAGAPLQPVEAGACRERDEGPHTLRLCTVREGDLTFTLAQRALHARTREALLGWAVVVGVLVGAFVAGLVARTVARYALVPVEELRDRVRRLDAAAPDPETLDPGAPHVEVEELRAALRELVTHLGESLAHARAFSAQAAHELRTPLAALSVELELLAESPEPRAADIHRLRGDVGNLSALTERLLVLASPGRLTATETVDLADVVEDVLCAHGRSTRVRTDIEEDVLVRGDAPLLRALLTNAVENALKFSLGEVFVHVFHREGTACVDVVDEGPGISPEDQARAFAPFFRAGSARASGTAGHGIGLALVAHVAAAHGGTVSIVPGSRGLHLHIALPAWAPTSVR